MTNNIENTLGLKSRVYGCWLGKSIGGTLGLPAEGKMERLDFKFYDPVPTIAPPNDDLELQLVWLHLVEQGGKEVTQKDFAEAWLRHIHYMWDEYGRCRWNLRRGVPASAAGTYENWFHAGMGSPIRSEIWACLFPNQPASAAYYAALDASLDHGVEGIAGEVFFAVMQNLVLSGIPILEAIDFAIKHIPESSATWQAIHQVGQDWADGLDVWACWEQLLASHGHENFTHAPLNVALTVWALLYGNGDFEQSILLATNGGYDTDCTAATVGATLGLLLGAEAIPQHWSKPIGNGVYLGPGILGIDAPEDLEALTRRTLALIGKLEPKAWDDVIFDGDRTWPELSSLPGTIMLEPLGGGATVPWANGELPPEIKAAGGAEWTWEVSDAAERRLTVLVRAGATLSLDGRELHTCPAGLPYVPATHRCAEQSVVVLTPSVGTHRIRLELASQRADQDASVILAYPNRHIAPWTALELPNPAIL